jgi:hypothetical protein
MSFDAWVVGFGLSRVLIELKLLGAPWAYSVMAITIMGTSNNTLFGDFCLS